MPRFRELLGEDVYHFDVVCVLAHLEYFARALDDDVEASALFILVEYEEVCWQDFILEHLTDAVDFFVCDVFVLH